MSPEQQRESWASCRAKPFRQWQMWLTLALGPLIAWAMSWVMGFVETDRRHAVLFYCCALILSLPGALWGLLLSQVHITLARRYLRDRAGVCPRCGYDLRATPDRCPECGTATEKP